MKSINSANSPIVNNVNHLDNANPDADIATGERLVVQPTETGQRIDQYLVVRLPEYSRAQWQRQITAGEVLVNERVIKASYRVQSQDIVDVELPIAPLTNLIAEALPLDIVYEDAAILVVNKPAGLVVHPAAGINRGTLANALVAYFQPELIGATTRPTVSPAASLKDAITTVGSVASTVGTTNVSNELVIADGVQRRPGIVHRLDRDTSGLLIVAKTETAYQHLTAQFAARTVEKRYIALVYGQMPATTGVIDLPIGRHKTQRTKMCVAPGWGRAAHTRYRVLRHWDDFSLLEVEIKTGRTHQIRVHLAHQGHPVVADEVYGAGRINTLRSSPLQKIIRNFGRYCLHAQFLALQHPTTLARLQFHAPLPQALTDLLEKLT
jgi:23S rRNA pseudouridine1911/1915/1917 synthase